MFKKKNKTTHNPMCWEPKGKFAYLHLKNGKSSRLTNIHVLLLSNQELAPPPRRKTGFKLKNAQAKHRYKLTYLTNQVLLSWHHLYYETSQKLQWSGAIPHVSQFSEPNFPWEGEAFIGSLKKDLFLFESSNFNFNPSKNSIRPDTIVSGQNLHSKTQNLL